MLKAAKKTDTKHGAVASREESVGRFIPYTRHIDDTTLKTKEGYLLKIIKLEGLPFETADQIDLNARKNVRATLLHGLSNSRFAVYHHILRREVSDELDGFFENDWCRDLDNAYQERLAKKRMFVNEQYITIVRRPAQSKIGFFAEFTQKMDMGGSAAVVGLIKTLALRGAKCNAVGIVGLAENMPSSIAYRPGDVITTYAGKTIEVLNTDAEGRLVLADCLSYMQETYSPEFVIDLATLTGAILVALGHEYCGTFVNDDTLWKQMEKASAASGEKLWRMPLDEVWTKEVESEVADLQNTGKSRNAGSCTAAAFLGHFINEGTRWAHMDIAGTAWRKSDQPTVPKFGSGFGVRVLNDLVAKYYEG